MTSATAAPGSSALSKSRKCTSLPARRAAAATNPSPMGNVGILSFSVLAEISKTFMVFTKMTERADNILRCASYLPKRPATHEYSIL